VSESEAANAMVDAMRPPRYSESYPSTADNGARNTTSQDGMTAPSADDGHAPNHRRVSLDHGRGDNPEEDLPGYYETDNDNSNRGVTPANGYVLQRSGPPLPAVESRVWMGYPPAYPGPRVPKWSTYDLRVGATGLVKSDLAESRLRSIRPDWMDRDEAVV